MLARLYDATSRALVALVVVLQVSERLVLVVAALALVRGGTNVAGVLGASVVVLALGRSALRIVLASRIRRRLVGDVVRGLLDRDPALPFPGGEAALHEGLGAAEEALVDVAPSLVGDAIGAACVALIAAVALPHRVVVFGALAVALAGLVAEALRRFAVRTTARGWEAFGPVADALAGCLHAGGEIVANGQADAERGRVRALLASFVRARARAEAVSGMAGRIPSAIALAGALGVTAWDQMRQGVDLATALRTATFVAALLPSFVGLARAALGLARTREKTRFLEPLLAPPVAEGGTARPPGLPTTIALEEVSYAYPGAPALSLAPISLEWHPRELLAIAGPNGAGKSTIFRLLLGFDHPTKGEVKIAEARLRDCDVAAWRKRIAYVPQRPWLPERATVRDAVRLLAPEASDEAILAALRKVELADRLSARSHDRPLDVAVQALSAGERQRVAIARALARDAALVLLDEPDAALDAASVDHLGALLRELARSRMVAFIAHDPKLLDAADRLVRIEAPLLARPPRDRRVDHGGDERLERRRRAPAD